MLFARKLKTLMCSYPKTWDFIGKPPFLSLTLAKECSTQTKIFFCVIAQRCWKVSSF